MPELMEEQTRLISIPHKENQPYPKLKMMYEIYTNNRDFQEGMHLRFPSYCE
jgi:hypothetical protein